MNYLIEYPGPERAAIPLVFAADAMARAEATFRTLGADKAVLQTSVFKQLRYAKLTTLLEEARAGRLVVCNQHASEMSAAQVISKARIKRTLLRQFRSRDPAIAARISTQCGPAVAEAADVTVYTGAELPPGAPDPVWTEAQVLYTTRTWLNEWASRRGSSFTVEFSGVALVTEGVLSDGTPYSGWAGLPKAAAAAASEVACELASASPAQDVPEQPSDPILAEAAAAREEASELVAAPTPGAAPHEQPGEFDLAELATPDELVEAFGSLLPLSAFRALKDRRWLKAARKIPGKSGRQHSPPLFCPYLVMVGLTKTKKGERLPVHQGWSVLKTKFKATYQRHRLEEPRSGPFPSESRSITGR